MDSTFGALSAHEHILKSELSIHRPRGWGLEYSTVKGFLICAKFCCFSSISTGEDHHWSGDGDLNTKDIFFNTIQGQRLSPTDEVFRCSIPGLEKIWRWIKKKFGATEVVKGSSAPVQQCYTHRLHTCILCSSHVTLTTCCQFWFHLPSELRANAPT